jgi:uncharacterized protein
MAALIDALIDGDSEPYWLGLSEGRLLLKRCLACQYLRPPAVYRTNQPSPWLCPNCLSEDSRWEQLSGIGQVETFVWYMEDLIPASPDFEPFKLPIPYNVALVRLDEGPRVITNILEIGVGDLAVGDRVRVAFVPVQDRTILRFQPALCPTTAFAAIKPARIVMSRRPWTW